MTQPRRDWQEVRVVFDCPNGETALLSIIHSRKVLKSRKVFVGGPISLNIPQYRIRGQGRVEAIVPSEEIPDGEGLVVSCVYVKHQPDDKTLPPIEKRNWQQIHVRMDESDGTSVFLVLLNSREWMLQHNVTEGGKLFLNLPERGVRGAGLVTRIEPSPVRGDSEGRVMTFMRGKLSPQKAVPCPAVRTYFGERSPDAGQEWVLLELLRDGGFTSDLRLARTTEWMEANWSAVEKLRKVEHERPTDISEWRLVRVTVAVQEGQKVHIALFWPVQWVEAHGLTVGESALLRLPKDDLSGEGTLTAIDPAPYIPAPGTPFGHMWTSGKRARQGKSTMAMAEVGDYVITYTHEERRDRLPIDETQGQWVARQRVRLRLDREDGTYSCLVLLRNAEWVRAESAVSGGTVRVNMPEMSCVGDARVESIEPCMVFTRWGDSSVRMVTGTFQHSAGLCGDLILKGEPEPIGVTPGHPFWSEDRFDWVPVGELRVGELVKTLEGTTAVESYTMRDEPEPTFNMEVEGDHVYRVGEQGILVHNSSAPACCTDPFSDGLQPLETVMFNGKSVTRSTGVKNANIPPATVLARQGMSGQYAFNRTGPGWWNDFKTANPVTAPDSWQRGHLLGSQLGGEGGSTWANMAPLHSDANKSVMVMCENRIAEYITTCNDCVTFSATPVYSGDNLHPNYILLEVVSKAMKTNGTPAFRLKVRVYNQVNPPERVRCQAGSTPSCS